MNQQDTICAVSTAAGVGGVALIRVSGLKAIEIANNLFVSTREDFDLLDQPGYSVHFGRIIDCNELIDEVLVTLFRSPYSYTGEHTVEIACHGSIYIQQRILQLLIASGARLAAPGEFTQRAFVNGKMDLSQAEAVADLIASSSSATHRLAISQMRGGFSERLSELRKQLLHFVSLIELELDFSEEEVEFVSRPDLLHLAREIRDHIARLASSFQLGNAIKNGIPVVIVGETNAGKSTLLNLLLNEEKAIVSDIHGTTRDAIEDTVNLGGFLFRFIDTAGLRETTDAIETIGIERAYRKMEQAQIILWLVDVNTPIERIAAQLSKFTEHFEGKQVMMVFNKVDQIDFSVQSLLAQEYPDALFISAKSREGEHKLIARLLEESRLHQVDGQDVIVSNIRHFESLTNAQQSIERAIEGIEQHIPIDLATQDIREAMGYLGEITGSISDQDILKNIFERFCIGK